MDDIAIRGLGDIATEAGLTRLANEALVLAEKQSAGRFYVACVGQFKRGKSSLIDALLGEPLLPVGILPVTSIPTIVQYGREQRADVRFENGSTQSIAIADVAEYVSEAKNPRNEKQVAVVELNIPTELLRDWLCRVDTPGISSIFELNTSATSRFVPRIDVALLVLGTDPPISRDELDLARTIARHADDFIVVLNKADRSAGSELSEASAFAAANLKEYLGREAKILLVSAREQLDGNRDSRDCPASSAP